MLQFQVIVRDVTFKGYLVEAPDKDEAIRIVQEGEAEDPEILDGGEWEIVEVANG